MEGASDTSGEMFWTVCDINTGVNSLKRQMCRLSEEIIHGFERIELSVAGIKHQSMNDNFILSQDAIEWRVGTAEELNSPEEHPLAWTARQPGHDHSMHDENVHTVNMNDVEGTAYGDQTETN